MVCLIITTEMPEISFKRQKTTHPKRHPHSTLNTEKKSPSLFDFWLIISYDGCIRAVSSVVERFIDIEEVGGPIPPPRTRFDFYVLALPLSLNFGIGPF